MNRSYPHYTKCAKPGDSYPYVQTFWGLTWDAMVGLIAGGGIAALLAYVAGTIGFLSPCSALIVVFSAVAWWAPNFKHWYYNHRLMCIEEEQCVVGTLVGNTWISFDGDQKFDVLVAPFSTSEVEQYFRQVISQFPEQYGVGPTSPSSQALGEYIVALDGVTQRNLYMRVVRERMLADQARAFYAKFLIRIESAMGIDAFQHTPDDTFAAAGEVNPMFRMSPGTTSAPFLHQELEGYRMGILLDKALTVALVGLGATIAFCSWLGPVGGLIAAAIAALLWFLLNWIDDPDDWNAQQTDAGLVDPAYEGGEISSIRLGDTIAVYGDWIADEEHDNYFELHPVRAIYLLCRSESGDAWEPVDDLTSFDREGRCGVDVSTLTQEAIDDICSKIREAERPSSGIEFVMIPSTSLLSMASGIAAFPAVG